MKLVKPDLVSTTGSITRASSATYFDKNGILQTATTNQVRFGYDPYTKEFIGVIVENQATNLCPFSYSFTNWSNHNVSLTSGITAPDSSTNAYKIYADAVTDLHYIYRQYNATVSSYRFSVFAKSLDSDYLVVWASPTGGALNSNKSCCFNLSDGTIHAQLGDCEPTIEKISNSYYRLSILIKTDNASLLTYGLANAVSSNTTGYVESFQGDGTGVVVWGAQLENSLIPTSLIQTNNSTATRAADVVTGSGIVYTNTTNHYSEWSSASVAYTIGQYVVVGTYTGSNTVSISDSTTGTYKCLANHTSSVSNGPLQSSTNWVRVGPTNQFAMFDGIVSSATTATNDITYVIKTNSFDTIGLFNLIGSKVVVAVADATLSNTYDSNVVFHDTRYLTSGQSYDWLSYFDYDPYSTKTQIVVEDIQSPSDCLITISITASGSVQAGLMVEGESSYLGATQYGASAGIIDYSRKETDTYGNTSLVVRAYSKRLNAKLFVDSSNVNKVQRLLYNVRATPVLWIGSEDANYEEPLTVFGFYRDFSTEISYPSAALCNLEIEGLI